MKLEVEINPVEEQPGDHSGSDLLLPTSTTGNTAPLVESGDAADKGFRQLRRLRSLQSISIRFQTSMLMVFLLRTCVMTSSYFPPIIF